MEIKKSSLFVGAAVTFLGAYSGAQAGESLSEGRVENAANIYNEATENHIQAERLLPNEPGVLVTVEETEVPAETYQDIMEPYIDDPKKDQIIIEDGKVKIIQTLEASTAQKGEEEPLVGRDAIMADLEKALADADHEHQEAIDSREVRVLSFAGAGGIIGFFGGTALAEAGSRNIGKRSSGEGKAKKSKAQWDDGRGSGRQPSSF